MKQPLVLFVALVLVLFCRGQEWKPNCHELPCPLYKVLNENSKTEQGFEERSYQETHWITTKLEGHSDGAVLSGRSTLKDYCNKQTKAEYTICDDTWPVLIIIKENSYNLSWFVRPGATKPENNDASVTQKTLPPTTFYVGVFGGTPSLEKGKKELKKLRDALDKAGKKYVPNFTIGATYDLYLAIRHHNEVWMQADNGTQ